MKTTILLLAAATAAPLHASVLMLDFGGATISADAETNSPYHTVAPGFTSTTWNKVQNADLSSGLLFADGTMASSVGVNLGTSTTTAMTLATNPGGTIAGNATTYGTGIYAGTNPPARDGIFQNTTNSNLGIQITGLAAGIYDVFIHSRNTNTGFGHTQTSQVAAGASGDFNFAAYPSQTIVYAAPVMDSDSTWVQGGNYTRFQVTLTGAAPALNLGLSGGAGEGRAFANLVQIVPVPEPSAALLGALGGLLLLRRRR